MKKALVVGIDNYPGTLKLKGCVNDASQFSELIGWNSDGTPNYEVLKKLNVQRKTELIKYVKELFEGDGDSSLLYFSGHGHVDTLSGYLVTPDFEEEDPGMSMNDIIHYANSSRVKNKIIILDCCHSGIIGDSITSKYEATDISVGVSILTSSTKDQLSYEKDGQGIFTSLLLDALRGGAADVMGNITPGSVYAYIDQALGAWEQRPVFKTNVNNFTCLRKADAPIERSVLRELPSIFVNPVQEFKLNPSFEVTNDNDYKHEVIEPHANIENTIIFSKLQKLESVGLVVPVGEEHMYFAAMKTKSCKLTNLGLHYWRLAKKNKI